ncbi:MAG: hypothetical protein CM15mP120_23100 [Pseudomonadota bacterium]|nr:MAG: hypothetical protein CM15mP120_23100 [Pseudomonadota bacterium]
MLLKRPGPLYQKGVAGASRIFGKNYDSFRRTNVVYGGARFSLYIDPVVAMPLPKIAPLKNFWRNGAFCSTSLALSEVLTAYAGKSFFPNAACRLVGKGLGLLTDANSGGRVSPLCYLSRAIFDSH